MNAIVDRLAFVKAQIAELSLEEERLKKELIDLGETYVEGTFHAAAISWVPGRVKTDWKTVAQKYSPSRQLIAAHTSAGEDYVQVKLSARKFATA